MSILRTSRFKGGDPAEMAAIAREAKKIWVGCGATLVSYRRYQGGAYIGQSVFIARFPDWTSLGKALDRLEGDPAYQALAARVRAASTPLDVEFLSEIDIG